MKEKVLRYGKLLVLIYVLLIVLNLLVLPQFDIISIDNFILPPVVAYLFWHYRANKLFWMSFILVCIKVSTELVSSYINHPELSMEVVLWSFVWCKYFAFSWAALHLFSDPKIFKYLNSGLQWLINIIVLINLLQMLGIPHFSEFLQKIYVNNQFFVELNIAAYDGFRLLGTQINPNNNAVVLLLLLLMSFILNLKLKYFNAGVLMTLIFFTQSRTIFVVLIITLIIIHSNFIRKFKLKQMILVITSFLAFVVLSSFLGLNYLLDIINGSAFTSNSFLTRLQNVNVVLDKLNGKWFFGYGKILDFHKFFNKSIDNEFAYEISQYGVIGILLFLSFVVFISLNLFSREFKRYGIIFLVLIGFIGITNLTLLNHQVGLVFLMIPILSFAIHNVNLKQNAEKYN